MGKFYKLFLLIAFTAFAGNSMAVTWTINNSGNTFTPNQITINLGDTVVFSIQSNHNAVEVTQATWQINGNTSNGGFQLPFGGGTVIPTMAKTYYYVCTPHASLGMKGQIIVNNSTGIPDPVNYDYALSFLPNPASNQTVIHTGIADGISNTLTVYDLTGKSVMKISDITENYILNISRLKHGIYFVEFKAEGYIRTSKLVVSE